MMADSFTVEILPDGRIKAVTDAVSGPAHVQAEQFFKLLSDLLGEPVTRERRADVSRVQVGADLRGAVHSHGADGHSHDHDHDHN